MAEARRLDIVLDAIWKGADDIRQATSDIDRAKDASGKAKTGLEALGSIGSAIAGAGLGLVALKIKEIGQASLELASDAAETASLIDNSLGPAADGFRDKIEAIADATGRSKQVIYESSSGILAMAKNMGFAQTEAGNFAAEMSQAALDLESFFNGDPGQGFADLQSALSGSSEVMNKYGIDVKETTLKQMALAQGIIATASDAIPRQERALLLLQAVQTQAADAMGDAERTSDGYANTSRGLSDALRELGAEFGESLIEPATEAKSVLTDLARALTDYLGNVNDLKSSIKDSNVPQAEKNRLLTQLRIGAIDAAEAMRQLNEIERDGATFVRTSASGLDELADSMDNVAAAGDRVANSQRNVFDGLSDTSERLEYMRRVAEDTGDSATRYERTTQAAFQNVAAGAEQAAAAYTSIDPAIAQLIQQQERLNAASGDYFTSFAGEFDPAAVMLEAADAAGANARALAQVAVQQGILTQNEADLKVAAADRQLAYEAAAQVFAKTGDVDAYAAAVERANQAFDNFQGTAAEARNAQQGQIFAEEDPFFRIGEQAPVAETALQNVQTAADTAFQGVQTAIETTNAAFETGIGVIDSYIAKLAEIPAIIRTLVIAELEVAGQQVGGAGGGSISDAVAAAGVQ